jgi:hypothetical protein
MVDVGVAKYLPPEEYITGWMKEGTPTIAKTKLPVTTEPSLGFFIRIGAYTGMRLEQRIRPKMMTGISEGRHTSPLEEGG